MSAVQVVMQLVRLLPDGHRMKREVDMALDSVSETMTPMHYHLREIIICTYRQVQNISLGYSPPGKFIGKAMNRSSACEQIFKSELSEIKVDKESRAFIDKNTNFSVHLCDEYIMQCVVYSKQRIMMHSSELF